MSDTSRLAAAAALLLVTAFGLAPVATAGEPPERFPARWGGALSLGKSYSPTGRILFQTVTVLRDWDYAAAWGHAAPAGLRFKAEATAGLAEVPEVRLLASGNIMALRYIDPWASPRVRPYVEAGIGLIYTDFRVHGQGLRLNFNPQLGAGVEVGAGEGRAIFAAVRGHHVSNANLYRENTGINSIVFSVGMLH